DRVGELLRRCTLRLGSGVEGVAEGAPRTVRFKRYRPPRPLAGQEADVVRFALSGGSVGEGLMGSGSSTEAVPLIWSLERAGVVECVLEKQACAAAGIRSPSS